MGKLLTVALLASPQDATWTTAQRIADAARRMGHTVEVLAGETDAARIAASDQILIVDGDTRAAGEARAALVLTLTQRLRSIGCDIAIVCTEPPADPVLSALIGTGATIVASNDLPSIVGRFDRVFRW